jgi:hypothetical protein
MITTPNALLEIRPPSKSMETKITAPADNATAPRRVVSMDGLMYKEGDGGCTNVKYDAGVEVNESA